jgi:hypothetical protein
MYCHVRTTLCDKKAALVPATSFMYAYPQVISCPASLSFKNRPGSQIKILLISGIQKIHFLEHFAHLFEFLFDLLMHGEAFVFRSRQHLLRFCT